MDNTGSFGAAIGGADPIQEAMARRSTGQAGATQQVSPSAPGFDPMTQAPQSTQPGGQAPMTAPPATGLPPMDAAQMGIPQQSPEAQIIVQAFVDRLKNDSKMKLADQKFKQQMGGLNGGNPMG